MPNFAALQTSTTNLKLFFLLPHFKITKNYILKCRGITFFPKSYSHMYKKCCQLIEIMNCNYHHDIFNSQPIDLRICLCGYSYLCCAHQFGEKIWRAALRTLTQLTEGCVKRCLQTNKQSQNTDRYIDTIKQTDIIDLLSESSSPSLWHKQHQKVPAGWLTHPPQVRL